MFLQRGEVFSAPRAPFVYRNGTERSVAAFRSFDRASILEHRLPFRKSFASEISLASLLNYPSAHSFNVFVSCVCCVYFFKKRRYLYINLQAEYRCLSRYLSSRLYILLHIMYIYIYVYIGLSFGFFVSKNSFETIGRSYSFQFRPKHSINELNGPSRKSFKRIKMLNVTFFR